MAGDERERRDEVEFSFHFRASHLTRRATVVLATIVLMAGFIILVCLVALVRAF